MKVNVDAAISKNLGRASMAVVARDQAGMFLGASGVVLEDITDVETAEAIACKESLGHLQCKHRIYSAQTVLCQNVRWPQREHRFVGPATLVFLFTC
jgi:ribonuclease HI